jgi:hypothetical protein
LCERCSLIYVSAEDWYSEITPGNET